MGIDNTAARMILLLRSVPGVSFERTLTFGRQKNYIGSQLRNRISQELGVPKSQLAATYSDEFLFAVGARQLQVLDLSAYEDATVIQDLNVPIPEALREQFSVVMDIGTSEHVYNVSQSLQNLKDLCKPNGHVLIVSPANSYLGHGFYQFSPELFYRTFDAENGFEILSLYLIKKSLMRESWYRLSDPKNMSRRGNVYTRKSCYIAAIAMKTTPKQMTSAPQQSDYVSAWETRDVSSLGAIYLRMPQLLRRILDVTLIALLSRYRSRLTPIHFHWEDGKYIPKQI